MKTRPLFAKAALAAAIALGSASASAQYTDGVIKLGVINDMSGLYADIAGPGSLWAARKAVEDFGAAAKGLKVEVIGADHQNKPDVGSNIVRQWFDVEKVDAVVDVPTSSVALAVNQIHLCTRERSMVKVIWDCRK
ncbi:MAG: ABC transporter substrate-binding protein, partial [Burkholderiaceae bacterium]